MNYQELQLVIDDQAKVFWNIKPKYLRRLDICSHISSSEIGVITGVRRCGKSTFMRQLAEEVKDEYNIYYLNLDDPRLIDFEASDFEMAYQYWKSSESSEKEKSLLLFDEPHECPGWERWISFFATKPNTKVYITGSNAKLLSSELSTYLTGRHYEYELLPLSLSEIALGEKIDLKKPDPESLLKLQLQYFSSGGFPKVFIEQSLELLEQYHKDIVTRDIAIRHKVRNIRALNGLARILAAQNTRLYNKSKIAKALEVKLPATIAKMATYFTETFLYSEIKLYSRSERERIRSLSKFYCIDPILAQRISIPTHDPSGATLENMIFLELRRRGYEVFYWRLDNKIEVDFIASKAGVPELAIQSSYSIDNRETESREIAGLKELVKKLNPKNLLIITFADKNREIKISRKTITVMPFWRWAML